METNIFVSHEYFRLEIDLSITVDKYSIQNRCWILEQLFDSLFIYI